MLLAVVSAVTAPAVAESPDTSGGPVDGVPLCGAAAGAGVTADDGVLRVGTFNLLHSDTDEGDATLAARFPIEADAIAGANVDVIGVQEATRNNEFAPGDEYPQKHGLVVERLAAALAQRTGHTWEWCWSLSNPHVPGTPDVEPGGGNPLDDMAAQFGNTPDPGDFREGVGIITRFHIAQARFRHMAPRSYEAAACVDPDPFCRLDAAFDARQVLWAHVQQPGGALFDMFTTHIAHEVTPLSPTTKLLQIKEAQQIVSEWSTPDALPDFLVGDFNTGSTDPAAADRYAAMIDAGYIDTYLAGGGVECTAPGVGGCTGNPHDGDESFTATATRVMDNRIDYVWALPGASCALLPSQPALLGDNPVQQPDGRWLWGSDHLGSAATIAC